MAWFQLTYRPEVTADLASIDATTAQRLLDKTKWLASNVGNLRHEPLTADLPDLSKYAVGDWRILYSINRDERLVSIHWIAHRRDLYQTQT
ncbi:MAG: type II toxin-antitoxin system RelE/ParE family toxin [Nitrospirota bacterium]|nr:type II toxin-antitoxin system RelE/ParE family toxin [Nitrospirota bacterium]MDE3117406.1 type II toxin-antitoxin system RelE/ParE family toxin [Nitrospirota bacterium]MDE3241592.1 type II toxin-antitoxin system RelE/ParE family toxin [Nitrospirota bacterium]